MHWKEANRTTNTAKLATLALPNSEIRVRGDRRHPLSPEGLLTDGCQSLLLFPATDAVELSPELVTSIGRPIHLLVADGSWKQARKVATREAFLKEVPRVKLGPGAPSSYLLRQTPHREKLSTFEAIARALGVIEGPEAQLPLEALFETLIERTLWSRGLLPLSMCKTEIPQEAIQAFLDDGARG